MKITIDPITGEKSVEVKVDLYKQLLESKINHTPAYEAEGYESELDELNTSLAMLVQYPATPIASLLPCHELSSTLK